MKKAEVINEVMGLQQQLSEVLRHYAAEYWRKLDVPVAQLKSLFIITSHGDMNFRALARDLGVTPGNVTGIVDRLVEQGLLSRKPSAVDRREILLEATAKGRDLLNNLRENQSQEMTRVLEQMKLADLTALEQGLSAFINSARKQWSDNSPEESPHQPRL